MAVCDNCSAQLPEGDRFCSQCGSAVGVSTESVKPSKPSGKTRKEKRRRWLWFIIGMLCLTIYGMGSLLFGTGGDDGSSDKPSASEQQATMTRTSAAGLKATATRTATAEQVSQLKTSTDTPKPADASTPKVARATSTPMPEATAVIHIIQAGDTIGKVAGQYGVTIETLVAINSIEDPDTIEVGQELVVSVPAGWTPPPTNTPKPTNTPLPAPPAATPTPESNVGKWFRKNDEAIRIDEIRRHGNFKIWKPEVGNVFVSLFITYRHAGTTGTVYTEASDFSIRTNEGIIHGRVYASLDPEMPSVGLTPGAEKGGWITFQVEESASSYDLIWSPTFFGSDIEIPLR